MLNYFKCSRHFSNLNLRKSDDGTSFSIIESDPIGRFGTSLGRCDQLREKLGAFTRDCSPKKVAILTESLVGAMTEIPRRIPMYRSDTVSATVPFRIHDPLTVLSNKHLHGKGDLRVVRASFLESSLPGLKYDLHREIVPPNYSLCPRLVHLHTYHLCDQGYHGSRHIQ